jgi:biotin synthase
MSAGRGHLNHEAQALCFYAGANSLFYGDKLLTALNDGTDKDLEMLRKLGINIKKPNPDLLAPLPNPDEPLFPENEPHPCTEPGPCRAHHIK